MVHRRGAVLAAQGKDKKMANETSNLFNRRDTFFGICEAVGQDFGFNPLWLRLAFVAPLFFFPVQTFIGYFALGGGIELSAHWLASPVLHAATRARHAAMLASYLALAL